MNAEQIKVARQQKDDFFRLHPQSPLTPEQQKLFTGLSYYDYDPALDLTVTVEPFDEPLEITMPTSTGAIQRYRRYGEFRFEINGEPVRLTIYEADGSFFLPFADASAGKETYGAGRYLEPELLGGDTFHVDLNQAYNPYCAYNDHWSCPITPPENRLNVAIRAGEKLPEGAWVEEH